MVKKHVLLVVMGLFIASCGSSGGGDDDTGNKIDLSNFDCVSIMTNKGEIELALDKLKAPDTVSNFLGYVNDDFYNGTIFHRVIDGFMIQGGGFDESFNQKVTNAPIMNEANNGLMNDRGTIAMARTSDPHSATSQFFINTVDNNFLDFTAETPSGWGYAVFGFVVTGMEVVDTISDVVTGAGGPFTVDVPQENIVIQTAEVIACADIQQ